MNSPAVTSATCPPIGIAQTHESKIQLRSDPISKSARSVAMADGSRPTHALRDRRKRQEIPDFVARREWISAEGSMVI